ncbi:hypothetical protein [Dysgonomonas macrotermitis]|uniref:Uncharacterized protein n=1 Tax=Dysgonomonas macrotermitis TaxID=1346286 RepID=A0A1M4UKW5_9BACT|nr:hypothetical protein [Dysgonomonas macrotermitis]SHE57295.1 hypothetical protein SAMN05444362_101633 [Dysgonomonas macrotermitis]
MRKEKTIDICHRHLFDDVDTLKKIGIPPQIIERIKRIRSIYTIWNDYPTKKDKEMRDKLTSMFNISMSEAYEDIRIIKQLLGDFNNATKAFHRFRANAMFLEAFELARIKKNPIAEVMAGDKYAKYNQLDKEDSLEFPWEDIMPQNYEPTSDPTVIGIKPIANIQEKIAAMKQKYMTDIEDVDYEDIGINPSLLENTKDYE